MDITLLAEGLGLGFNLFALITGETCQVVEYIDNLDQINQKQVVSLFNLITEAGIPNNIEKYRDIGDDISELKTRGGVRILCFTGGPGLPRSLILTHGFQKPHQKVLKREKQKALRWRDQFFQETVNIVNFNRR